MISPDRLLPQQQIYNFLRTLTIKFSPIAQYINASVIKKGYEVNDLDPTTWKYYLNMVGQYHPSDTPMYISSLDTQERILFSPEIFLTNPRTRTVYSPGGSYYNRLCETYPDQVDLIKSILFPVEDIEKAIAAPDLTLLGYGSGYLEIWEESVFIDEIKTFLNVLIERWYFDFLDDEPYFYLTFWGSLWVYLAMLLISGRMAHIRTPFVHSSDIWNELGAYGLDNYSDILDREKSMMLYQNISYFKANAGKQSNLVILADRLLKSFGIGLYTRKVVQESETERDNYQLTPQLVPVRVPKLPGVVSAQIEIKTVTTLQSEIFEKGLTNSADSETVEIVKRKLGDTRLNEFNTKFLEIRPIARNKPYAEILNMFLMETLIVSINEGHYTTPVELTDPLTTSPIYLLPSELLALYNYAILRSLGIKPDLLPSKARLFLSFTPTVGTPNKKIPHFGTELTVSAQVDATAFLSNLSYDQNIQSPAEFSNNASALFLRFLSHILADQNTLLAKRHTIYEHLTSLCHQRREEPIQLVPNHTTYEDWLGFGGIDLYGSILTQYELQSNQSGQWGNLADAIITALIPLNDTLRSFGNFTLSDSGYIRLRELFIQMCSYRVVFLESERDTSSYSIGAKWSSDYGPDETNSFSDFIIPILVKTSDTTDIESDLYLNTGFQENLTNDVVNFSEYKFNTNHTSVTTSAVSVADKFGSSLIAPATIMSQGPLNLNYVAPTFTLLDP